MTKEEFKDKLSKAGFNMDMLANLLCYNKHCIYSWLGGRTKFPMFMESLLNLLISLRQKLPNYEELKKDKEVDYKAEIQKLKKAFALKQENDKLREKIDTLKELIKKQTQKEAQ